MAVGIAIVGGGIGGCTLALALHDAGFDDPVVLEAVPQLRELGVGVNLLPHAVRELTELGLLDELEAHAIATAERAADVLVDCDGIHSTVRRSLHPAEGPALWNGIAMWRGVSMAPPFLGGRTMILAGVAAHRIVIYPILDRPDGRQLVNWVGEVRFADGQPMPRQDWSSPGSLDEVVGHFADFRFGWLDFPELMGTADEVFRYPMVDRDPLPQWGTGRISLLGDAAHPMYPVGSNGASQAILDARVLAVELATHPMPVAALAAYEAERRPATSAIVHANRRAGPERCMEIVAARAPDGFTDLHAVISRAELEEISAAYKRTAGFDPAVLNDRESWSRRRA